VICSVDKPQLLLGDVGDQLTGLEFDDCCSVCRYDCRQIMERDTWEISKGP